MRILVPVDFSPSSESALVYALQLRSHLSAEAVVFHAYPLQPKTAFLSLDDIIALEQEADAASRRQLSGFLEAFQQRHPDLDLSGIETRTRIGFAVENVINMTENEEIDLVVMGTKGAGNIQTRVLGTNTAVIMDNVSVPVIAVPAQGSKMVPRRIVLAVDLVHMPEKGLDVIGALAKAFGSQITLLHVVKPGHAVPSDVQQEVASRWKERLGAVPVSFAVVEASDVEAGILRHLDGNEADLLCMTMRQRTIFERIFQPSSTAHLSQDAKLPLMGLHAG